MASLHIVWIILNLSLAITLFLVSYRNFRSFSERYGWLPSLLVFVLVASMCQSPARQESKLVAGQYERTVAFSGQLPSWSSSQYLSLVDWPTIDLKQGIYLNQQPNSDSVRIASQTMLLGTVIGLGWRPLNTVVDIGADRHIHYSASGLMEWRLLGLTVYSQPMHFEGKQDYNPARSL